MFLFYCKCIPILWKDLATFYRYLISYMTFFTCFHMLNFYITKPKSWITSYSNLLQFFVVTETALTNLKSWCLCHSIDHVFFYLFYPNYKILQQWSFAKPKVWPYTFFLPASLNSFIQICRKNLFKSQLNKLLESFITGKTCCRSSTLFEKQISHPR